MPAPSLSLIIALAFQVILAESSGASSNVLGPFAPLVASGPLGIVLAWFMWRNERLQRQTAAAMDRMSKASMMMVAATPTAPARVRQEAHRMIAEIDKEEAARGAAPSEVV